MSHPLPLTGERTLPGVAGEEYWFARHEAAYAWVVDALGSRVRGAAVVEAGSGEGYGAAMLRAAGARSVLALEYDDASARHAHAAYAEVRTVRANLAMLPVADASADLLVTLQVVEHLWDLRGFLRDCARALCPGGTLVVTTPNRPVFSPGLGRGEKPTNPFHVEELDAEQLHDLLVAAGFADVAVHGLHHGPRIEAWETASGSGVVAAQVAAVLAQNPPTPDRAASNCPNPRFSAPGTEDNGSYSRTVPDGLDAFVSSVTASDFVVGAHEGAQDLVALAVRP